jgi:hypothetical protein
MLDIARFLVQVRPSIHAGRPMVCRMPGYVLLLKKPYVAEHDSKHRTHTGILYMQYT